MSEQIDELVRLKVACNARAPAVVRHVVSQERELGFATPDVVLIVSELVTNAVLHSGCSVDQAIEVRVSVSSERVLVSVRDLGCSGQGAQLDLIRAVGGRGLQIVDELAERWGSERDQDGHHVWAEVSLATDR